jgi:hypothetical protein
VSRRGAGGTKWFCGAAAGLIAPCGDIRAAADYLLGLSAVLATVGLDDLGVAHLDVWHGCLTHRTARPLLPGFWWRSGRNEPGGLS